MADETTLKIVLEEAAKTPPVPIPESLAPFAKPQSAKQPEPSTPPSQPKPVVTPAVAVQQPRTPEVKPAVAPSSRNPLPPLVVPEPAQPPTEPEETPARFPIPVAQGMRTIRPVPPPRQPEPTPEPLGRGFRIASPSAEQRRAAAMIFSHPERADEILAGLGLKTSPPSSPEKTEGEGVRTESTQSPRTARGAGRTPPPAINLPRTFRIDNARITIANASPVRISNADNVHIPPSRTPTATPSPAPTAASTSAVATGDTASVPKPSRSVRRTSRSRPIVFPRTASHRSQQQANRANRNPQRRQQAQRRLRIRGFRVAAVQAANVTAQRGTQIAANVGASVAARATGSITAGALGGQVAGAAASGLAALGPAGLAVAAGVGALGLATTAAAESVVTLARVMRSAARDVAQVSGIVAAAEAGNEVKRIQALLRRNREVGPTLGRFTEAGGDVAAALEDLKTSLVKLFGKPMGDITQNTADLLRGISRLIDKADAPVSAIQNVGGGVIDIIKGNFPILAALLDKLIQQGKDAREKDAQDLQRELLDFLNPNNYPIPAPLKDNRRLPKGIF